MNPEEALKAFFAMESESELSSLACTSSEESESDEEPCEKDFSDQEEEDQTPMQPDYKENISHPTCIQNGVFVEPVGTKREKNGKQTKKKTCKYCAKCEIFLCKECFEGFNTKSKV